MTNLKSIIFYAPRLHSNQYTLINELIKQGIEVHFYSIFSNGNNDYPTRLKHGLINPSVFTSILNNFLKINLSWFFFIPSLYQTLINLRKIKPNLIIVRDRCILSLIIYIIGSLNRIKVVLYLQSPVISGRTEESLLKILFNYMYPKTIISPVLHAYYKDDVDYDNSLLLKHRNNNTSYFVPFIVQAQKKIDKYNYNKSNGLRILCVARIEKSKNIELLLNVLKKLKKSSKKMSLTIVGRNDFLIQSEYYKYILSVIENNKLNESVKLISNVSHNEMRDIYLSHDLLVLPSRKEVASVAIPEAMSCGLPVISSNENGTSSYIINGYNGYVFLTEDANSLFDKMKIFLDDPKKCEDFGLNALSTARVLFNIRYFNDFISKI